MVRTVNNTNIPFFTSADNFATDACRFSPNNRPYTRYNKTGRAFVVGGTSVGATASDPNDYGRLSGTTIIRFSWESYGGPERWVILGGTSQEKSMSTQNPDAGAVSGVFRFGEFEFDCRLRQLLASGQPRHLSPKAQQLLRLLLVSRPRALSREELYDALWPSTFVSETNLATIVNEVRRALDDDARAPKYIRTAHSFGYAFCGELLSAGSAGLPAAHLVFDGRSHPLYEGENVVGRAPDSDVFIPAPTISRRHAVITIVKGTIRIKDFDSRNGTSVNGQRIGAEPVLVTLQTPIELGGITVTIAAGRTPSTSPLFPMPKPISRRSRTL